MSTTLLSPIAHAPHAGAVAPALLDALYDALVSERKLLDELFAQIRRQRSAV